MSKYLKPMQFFRESMTRTALKQSTVFLGLNVSDKFVSCAISDRLKMSAFQHGCFKRDERILDNLVDRVQECMSEYNVEGIVFASKLYPVGPPVNIHTLMDDLCKKGKFESLKYTCWKDNITSETADFVCNQFIDMMEEISMEIGQRGEGHLVDLLSARHMLQASLDFFNTFVERKTYLCCDEMEDSK